MGGIKYVSLRTLSGTAAAFAVPSFISHADFARMIPHKNLLGAGFFYLSKEEGERPEIRIFGKSQSLGMEPHPDDAFLLRSLLED